MIAKHEPPSLPNQAAIIVEHNFDVFEETLKVSPSELQEFLASTGLSIRSVVKAVWILHRHLYEGSSLVDFIELNKNFQVITEDIYQIDESQTLLQICESPISNSSAAHENAERSTFLFTHLGQHSDTAPVSRNVLEWEVDNIVTRIQWSGQSLKLEYLFDKSRVDERMIVSYWHTFERILHCVIDRPHQPLSEADFLSDRDRNHIIAWNHPLPEKPQQQTICTHVDHHVRNQPDRPAIYAWDGPMTYAELDNAASKASLDLATRGVGSGDIIPFCMEKSKWAVVAALAILKAGSALVPMDPDWPKQRIMSILEATEAKVVVCSRDTHSCLDGTNVQPFVLCTGSERSHSPSSTRLVAPSTRDIAFVLFSSGSTGVPKGMVREHGTACVGSLAHAEAMHINSHSRVLQFANHVFDVAMLDFFTTLIMGGCVCIPSEFDRRNNLAAFIQQSQANWVLLTPTVASMLDPQTVPSLRDVTLGGEAITPALLAKWLPLCRVGINYGSAEVDVTHARDVLDSQDPTNVGKRLPSCVCYVVDPENVKRVLPIGATGELVISGPTMARGYLRQPDKTAAAFVAAPVDWYHESSDMINKHWLSRAYRMGDLVQQQWDGSFRFVGRRDFQVKIRGQKVELGEIESHLTTHPAINLCAIMYPRSGPFGDRLVAVVELPDNGHCSRGTASSLRLEDIKGYLAARVPSYMLPQISIVVDSMPLTATLKIDRQKLMALLVNSNTIEESEGIFKSISTSLCGPVLSSDDITGLNISALIANLVAQEHSPYWDSISGHDNSFFQIGLDSVQIMRLSHLIFKSFNVKISVESLTDRTMTVKRLADLIDRQSTFKDIDPPDRMTSAVLKDKVAHHVSKVLGDVRAENSAVVSVEESVDSRLTDGQYRVFLTGATGYLGIHLLRLLLNSPMVEKVYVLVRSPDVMRARTKLLQTANGANCNIEQQMARVEIWLGDLSQPQLGLEHRHWEQLTKYRSTVNCIIHCGAIVDWTRSYTELEASNVMSTIELLKPALRANHTNFVYVSGGQYFQPGPDDSPERLGRLFEDAAGSNGYAQTKFVSEQIVNSVRSGYVKMRPERHLSSFQIIKPAYLIGTSEDGVANVNDYLWRIVSAAVQQGCYNADEDEQWLLAGDVGDVASTIVEAAVSTIRCSSSELTDIKILSGIRVRDFWSIIEETTGCKLQALPGQEWLAGVKASMESDSQHVLWPLLDAVEQNSGRLTSQQLPATGIQSVEEATCIRNAVRRNVEYLVASRFLTCRV